jgi:phosphopantothenoylcysteine decarboxylase/phosphopantothenate--cysteine ligase
MSVAGQHIILGVTGSIAAYKAVLLLRELTARGAVVTVVMSGNAEHFVAPLTFRTLSGRPVLSSLFDPQSEDAVEHVALAERAQAFVVAPATANLLAKAAHGIADDFLTTLLLAARCPILIAPAMDGGMWDHAAVQANVETLRERGVTVLEPEAGALASGLSGKGRLPETETLVEAVERALTPRRDLTGERVLVTSGPTREPIDPVRYLSNRSSGKMGHAVATAALRRGAEVVLISGPTTLKPPAGAVYVPVQTAEEMREAALQHLAAATVVIKAAAVADYRVEKPSATKIKSGGKSDGLTLSLVPKMAANFLPLEANSATSLSIPVLAFTIVTLGACADPATPDNVATTRINPRRIGPFIGLTPIQGGRYGRRPFINAVLLSTTSLNFLSGETVNVGLRNYQRLFSSSDYLLSMQNTIRFTIWSLAIKFATGMTMEPIVVEDDKLTIIVRKLGDTASKSLDIAMEDVDLSGIEVTRIIRAESGVPIVMLTAKDSELDKVVGLELGADDYVTKPFSLRELSARIRALFRRTEQGVAVESPPAVVDLERVQVDIAGHRLLRDGQPLPIKPKAFDLLAFLIRHPGQVFTRDQLLERVWGYDYAGETRTVDVHVHWLRSQVEADPGAPRFIHTVRGVGYVFRRPA